MDQPDVTPLTPYRDSALPPEARARDLLGRMTREEKIGQLTQIFLVGNSEELAARVRAGKVGSRILAFSALAGADETRVVEVEAGNYLQHIAVEETRLGIPLLTGRDVIHGHRTVFPIPLAQAATWDPELVEQACAVAAFEASSEGINWTFAPMLDIARDPRWGRVMEGYGEDPYLCSAMGAASVRGFQGPRLGTPGHVIACAKHYVGYGAAVGGRDYNTAEISDNTVHNIYLPPFKAAVDAGVASVMSAFHDLDGESASGNRALIRSLLKEQWGFDGLVVSDWASVQELIAHRVAENEKDAARIGFTAGVDIEMVTRCYEQHLGALIDEGAVPADWLDDAVLRVLRVKFAMGLFENPYVNADTAAARQLLPEHRATARKVIANSVVLLKNDGNLLPLPKTGKSIAVIGPMIESRREVLGNWELDGRPEDTVTILDGIRAAAPLAKIRSSAAMSDEMLDIARHSDVVVLVVGESHMRSGEWSSIADIVLPPGQHELIEAVCKVGKPTVVIVCAGRPLAIEAASERATALLYAWHPGTEAGNGIADILFGNINPSAKLPITLPRHTGQIPLYYNCKSTGRPINDYYSGTSSRYHDQPGTPLYPFGFGLSYTTFTYDDIRISATTIAAGQSVEVSARVTNTGQTTGEETAQCYVQDCVATTTRPVRELKGFQRVALSPGESKRITFTLGPSEMAFYGATRTWRVEPGVFKVWIGPDCTAALETTFAVH